MPKTRKYVAKISYRDEDVSYDNLILIEDNSFVDNLFTPAGSALLYHMTNNDIKDSSTLILNSFVNEDTEVVNGVSVESFFQLPSKVQIDMIEQSDEEVNTGTYVIEIQPLDTNPGLMEAYQAYINTDTLLSQFFNN